MPLSEFQIEFLYNDVNYIGLVQPAGHNRFRVNLENDNQETFMEVVLKPSSSTLEDWDFECGDGEDASQYFELGLLEEVGEQIESHLTGKATDLDDMG